MTDLAPSRIPAKASSDEETTLRRRIEIGMERTIFGSRWLVAPCYVGLIGALVLLVIKFFQELLAAVPNVFSMDVSQLILVLLTLVDLSLAANLLLMVIFAGYENFVSKIETGRHEDRPEWMGKVDFSGLKLKLISSIVAISGIHLLKSFMDVHKVDKNDIAWQVGIHLTFVVSGVLLAWMDRLSGSGHRKV